MSGRPGAHGDDQVVIATGRETLLDGLAHRGPLGRVEVARLPPGVAHELQGVAARVVGQELPHLPAAQAIGHRGQGQPAELLQALHRDAQGAGIFAVVAAFEVADAPFRAVRLGGGLGGEHLGGGRRGRLRHAGGGRQQGQAQHQGGQRFLHGRRITIRVMSSDCSAPSAKACTSSSRRLDSLAEGTGGLDRTASRRGSPYWALWGSTASVMPSV